ncbi:MAG: hypothetical protein JSU79_11590 [Dehalococcoidales bacterium]|nr:MAG: hypothetical protein JSU79_11590 [Dehalococcoidales bacterium]
MPHLSSIEKAGIPSVFIIFEDQDECWQQACRLNGIPSIRRVWGSRHVPGPEDVETWIDKLMDQLVRPLTEEEKNPPKFDFSDPRYIFEGTIQEAQEFFGQTEEIPQLYNNTPICKYTDGLPIVPPIEELVEQMLKGTSHKPDEIITYQADRILGDRLAQMGSSGQKGDPVHFMPMRRKATVEKVATIGVMAGCKPEHMPILLAIAEAGGGCGDGRGGMAYVVSGPYAKEIKMNFDTNVLGPGNPSNRSIGRAAELMWRNLGGNIPNVTNCGVWGNGLNNCFPENDEALPPGWATLREEYDFGKDDSCIVAIRMSDSIQRTEFMPGGYREFQKSGHGGIGRRLGVKGIPGPHNWLEYFAGGLWRNWEGGKTFLMLPEMARDLQLYGFKSKDEVYEWLYKQSFMTVREYRTHQRPDVTTNAWKGIEPTSGKPWKELDEDYMVPAVSAPFENCIIVTGGGEEMALWTDGRGANSNTAYSIDFWR